MNFEFYKDELSLCKNLKDVKLFALYHGCKSATATALVKGELYTTNRLYEWLFAEHDTLDEKEKEYLSAVIKPFKNDVKAIIKCNAYKHEYIEVRLRKVDYRFHLPMFEKGVMYKGMEADRPYTLQELGL